MLSGELWVIYALVFGTALFAVQGVYWVVFRARHERRLINRRLALSDRLEVLIDACAHISPLIQGSAPGSPPPATVTSRSR